jgi:hypothetical protein
MLADGSRTPYGPHALVATSTARLKRARASADGAAGGAAGAAEGAGAEQPVKKRRDRHAPVEERIARRPVGVLRDAVQRKGSKPLDPRFLPLGGDADSGGGDRAARRCAVLANAALTSVHDIL